MTFLCALQLQFSSNESNDTDDKDTIDDQNQNPYQKRSY